MARLKYVTHACDLTLINYPNTKAYQYFANNMIMTMLVVLYLQTVNNFLLR